MPTASAAAILLHLAGATPALAKPQQLPLVRNVRVAGKGATPRVSWQLPDLAGFDIDLDFGCLRGEAVGEMDVSSRTERMRLRRPVLEDAAGLTALRPHPAGLALLRAEQAFQEQARVPRNTVLIEQRTYPLLDLTKRRRP